MINTTAKPDGASAFGYHFFDEYRTCQRKFYLHQILGIEPPVKTEALVKGKAWHAMVEALLQGLEVHEALDLGNSLFRSPLWTIENLEQWAQAVSAQLPPGELVGTEGEVTFPLANGILVTGRLDGLWSTLDGGLYLLEHKTTSYRLDAAVRGLEQGDQLSMYLLACQRLQGKCDGVFADVTVFSKDNSATTSMWHLTRSRDDLIQFELGLIGTWRELAHKVRELDGGLEPAEILFPRCPNSCSIFDCPYADECRSKHDFHGVPLQMREYFDQKEVETKSPLRDDKQFALFEEA